MEEHKRSPDSPHATTDRLLEQQLSPMARRKSQRRSSRAPRLGADAAAAASNRHLLSQTTRKAMSNVRRAKRLQHKLLMIGDCCAPPDLVREHVQQRCVLVCLLVAMMFMSARLSLGSQYFVLPDAQTGPTRIEVRCPLVMPQLPNLHAFSTALQSRLMPLLFESGVVMNPQAVDYQYWGMKAAVATMQTAEQVFLPAIEAALASNKLPGTPAGEGRDSICDHSWFNITTEYGIHPPPVIRGLANEGRGQPKATFEVTIAKMTPAASGDDVDLKVVASCEVHGDKAGNVALWHLLKGYPVGLYNVTILNDAHGANHPQVCPPPAPVHAQANATMPPSYLSVVSMPDYEAIFVSGNTTQATVQVLDYARQPLPGVPLNAWMKFAPTVKGVHVALCARVMPTTQTKLSDANGRATFDFRLLSISCNGTMIITVAVAGSETEVVESYVEVRSTTQSLYFAKRVPHVMRVNAGGPYGYYISADNIAVAHEFGDPQAVQPTSNSWTDDLFGNLFFRDSATVPEQYVPPKVCVDPPMPGKQIVPLVASLSAAHQIGEVLAGMERGVNYGPLSMLRLNETVIRAVIGGVIGLPLLYTLPEPSDLTVYPGDTPFSSSVLPTVKFNESRYTDADGCVQFDDMEWTSGTTGPVFVVFFSDGNAVTGWTQLINADEPQKTQLAYLYERGLYDAWWLIFFIVLQVLFCGMHKRCNIVGRVAGLLALLAYMLTQGIEAFVFNWFTSETVAFSPYPIVGYVPACCKFTRESMYNDIFTLAFSACMLYGIGFSVVSLFWHACCKDARRRVSDEAAKGSWQDRVVQRLNRQVRNDDGGVPIDVGRPHDSAAYKPPVIQTNTERVYYATTARVNINDINIVDGMVDEDGAQPPPGDMEADTEADQQPPDESKADAATAEGETDAAAMEGKVDAGSDAEGKVDAASEGKVDPAAAPAAATKSASESGDGQRDAQTASSAVPPGSEADAVPAGAAKRAPPVQLSPVYQEALDGGSRFYARLRRDAMQQGEKQAYSMMSWWKRFLVDDGFDEYRLREYRAAMPALLRTQKRVLGKPKSSVTDALKKKAVRSWIKYRGSIVAVLIRFYKAWKLAFLSWGYLIAAVYWAIYVPMVVPLWCLVTSCSVPREHWRSMLSTWRHLVEVVGQTAFVNALLVYELFVLLWAAVADAMVFVPANQEVPLADADDQAYDTTMLGRRQSSGLAGMETTRCQRFIDHRSRWLRTYFCGCKRHGSPDGHKRFRRVLEQKQLETRSRLWTWITNREDHAGHVRRRRSTAASLAVMRNWMAEQGRAVTGTLKDGLLKADDAATMAESARAAKTMAKFRPPPKLELPFYFPQRFIWAFVISTFVSMLICSTGAVMASWLNELFRVSIHAWESFQSELHLHLPFDSTHPPVDRLEYIIGGYLLVQFKGLVGSGTYKIIMSIVPLGVPGAMLLVFCLITGVWVRMAVVYRRRIMALRMGKSPVSRSASSCTASMYIGYQLVHIIVGNVFLCVLAVILITLLVVIILVKNFQAYLWRTSIAITLTLLPSVILWLVTRLWGMFLARDFRLVYPVPFFYYDAVAMINNMTIGMIVVLKRVAILCVTITITFWRLDLLSGGSVTFDSGHGAYLSMLLMDHHNNNPIKVVFLDILRKEMNVLRALRKGGFVKGNVNKQKWSLKQYDPTFCGWFCCLPCLCKKCACFDPNHRRHELEMEPGTCSVQARVTHQRVVQRWHLYVMLIRNPSLRLLRKHRLKAITSFKKLSIDATAVAQLTRVKPRHPLAPWTARMTRIGSTDTFAHQQQLVLVRDGFFTVFDDEKSQSPSKALAFVSIGAVTRLIKVPEFAQCGYTFGFAIRALHKWYAFAVDGQTAENQWVKLLRREMNTAAEAVAEEAEAARSFDHS